MKETNPSSTTPRHHALTLFNKLYAKVQAYCFKLAWGWNNRPIAIGVEDLVQEALINVWEALPSFDPEKPIKPFIKVVAYNAFKDAFRRYGKYYSVPVGDADDLDALRRTLDSEETPTRVNTMLDVLTNRQKEILKMNFGIDQPCSYGISDIAEELGITRQTVSSDKKKALKALEERRRQKTRVKKMTL